VEAAALSRWRGRPRVVLEIVCHLHPDVVLIRRGLDLRSGNERSGWRTPAPQVYVGPGGTTVHADGLIQGRCPRPECRVNPQWRHRTLSRLLAALPEGIWRVTDVEMDRMIRDPTRAAEYLQIRGASVPTDRS
jgi:hypothetical protein